MSEITNTKSSTTEQIESATAGSNVLLYPASEAVEKTEEVAPSAETEPVESHASAQTDLSEADVPVQEETSELTLSAKPQTATEEKSPEQDNFSSDSSLHKTTSSPDEEDLFEEEEYEKSGEEKKWQSFFHFHSRRKAELSRDELILSRISDEDLMEYLRLEQQRQELLQKSKEVREKRIWTAFLLTISLMSIVLVIYFLKDNPTILVSILYTIGILVALYIWNKPKDKGPDKKSNK